MAAVSTTRILHDCFIQPYGWRINYYLEQALKMCEEHSAIVTRCSEFESFTLQAIACNSSSHKLYCLLVWIVWHPAFRSYTRKFDKPEVFDRFYNILCQQMDYMILGLKPDGSLFAIDGTDSLNINSVGFFIDRLRRAYICELTMIFPSSNASVQMVQSDE